MWIKGELPSIEEVRSLPGSVLLTLSLCPCATCDILLSKLKPPWGLSSHTGLEERVCLPQGLS